MKKIGFIAIGFILGAACCFTVFLKYQKKQDIIQTIFDVSVEQDNYLSIINIYKTGDLIALEEALFCKLLKLDGKMYDLANKTREYGIDPHEIYGGINRWGQTRLMI